MILIGKLDKVPNCLPNLTTSALSATKLDSDNDNSKERIMNLFDSAIDNPSLISSLTSKPSIGASEDGPHGLEVIQNISVKDGCVIGFMLALWLYSMILMFRYFCRIVFIIFRNIFIEFIDIDFQ